MLIYGIANMKLKRMERDSLDIELIDFLDLINETLSERFVERWRFRYSEAFLRLFQRILIKHLEKSKPIKIESMTNTFISAGYSLDQVADFYYTVDLEIYQPLVKGTIPAKDD